MNAFLAQMRQARMLMQRIPKQDWESRLRQIATHHINRIAKAENASDERVAQLWAIAEKEAGFALLPLVPEESE